MRKLLLQQRKLALSNIKSNSQISQLVSSPATYAQIEEILSNQASHMWSISDDLSRLLARAVNELRLVNVLEFGAGLSSLTLATALSTRSGGRLTSVEQKPEWCRPLWREVEKMSNVDAELVGSGLGLRLGTAGLYYWFKHADLVLARRGPYDLVLVDAPQGIYSRDGALHMARRHLSPNALIVLDDAGRNGEQWTLYRWLQTYPGLELHFFDTAFGERGVALLRTRGKLKSRLAIMASLSSIFHTLRYRHLRRNFDY